MENNNNEIIKELNGYLRYINHLKRKHTVEAKKKFPNHPYARKIWTMLCSMNGGMVEVVNRLQLQTEWENYQSDFHSALDAGMIETASMLVGDFNLFCREQLEENFYLFESPDA